MSTSPTYAVELLADAVSNIDPVSGGQYGRQVRIVLDMSETQRRCAVATMLSAMPEAEAIHWLHDVFPELFKVDA